MKETLGWWNPLLERRDLMVVVGRLGAKRVACMAARGFGVWGGFRVRLCFGLKCLTVQVGWLLVENWK